MSRKKFRLNSNETELTFLRFFLAGLTLLKNQSEREKTKNAYEYVCTYMCIHFYSLLFSFACHFSSRKSIWCQALKTLTIWNNTQTLELCGGQSLAHNEQSWIVFNDQRHLCKQNSNVNQTLFRFDTAHCKTNDTWNFCLCDSNFKCSRECEFLNVYLINLSCWIFQGFT